MTSATEQGVVLATSRRKVRLLVGDAEEHAFAASDALDVCVGDRVGFSRRKAELLIETIAPRRNCLKRSYQDVTKNIASNLDQLYLVSSVKPLFQPLFIDRVIAVCESENIPVVLIVNKSDLGLEETAELVRIYERIGIPLLYTSVKSGKGVDAIEKSLSRTDLKIVALAGLSGVGKSSLINSLIPHAAQRTGEVSTRTGQGRQTTSQAVGYRYQVPQTSREILVIDMPGIQNFGVSHLSKEQVTAGFLEFGAFAADCGFDNCSHVGENDCAVKDAVTRGEIAQSRYESYAHMLREVAGVRRY